MKASPTNAYLEGAVSEVEEPVELVEPEVDFLCFLPFLEWCFTVLAVSVDDEEVAGDIVPSDSCARAGPATRATTMAIAARSFIERILKVLSMRLIGPSPGRY
jgi:hypothetical protein